MRQIYTLILFLFCFNVAKSQIIINSTATPAQIAQTLVGNGVRISNVVLKGADGSYGKFRRISSNLPLDSGIVFTSGQAKTDPVNFIIGVDGDADNDEADNTNSTPGDSDLGDLINDTTYDACSLEFDFVPIGDSITFRYVFSSEEYPEYNCSPFNDVFAFFISGPGIIGNKNLALVPGTNIPVAINSVNNGIPGDDFEIDSCNAMGPGSPFVSYFIDNAGGITVTHDGFTKVFTARVAVQPCQTYHLKIAIADVSDELLDSGVFLEAGSLSSDAAEIVPQFPVDAQGKRYMAEGCNTGSFKVRLPNIKATPTTINISYLGTAIRNTDYTASATAVVIPAGQLDATVNMAAIIDGLPEGSEIAKIYIVSECNSTTYLDSTDVEIRDYDTLRIIPRRAAICSGGNIQLVADGAYTNYSWKPAATLSNPNIFNPFANPTVGTAYIATATLGTCTAKDSAIINIKRFDTALTKNIFCAGASDGYIRVRTARSYLTGVLGFSLNGGPFVADSNFNNLGPGIYNIRVRDASNCIVDTNITLVEAYPPLVADGTVINVNCSGLGSITATPAGGLASYTYSLNGITYQISNVLPSSAGPRTLYVKDANGCIATKNFVVGSDAIINFTQTVGVASCTGGADAPVTVTASGGSGVYSYSIGGIVYQSSNILYAAGGPQTVWVKDDNDCLVSADIIVPVNNTAVIDTRPDTTICEGVSVRLNTTGNVTGYSWSPPNGLSSTNDASPFAKPTGTTKYYVLGTLGLCTKLDSVTITIRPAPIPFAGNDTSICFGTPAYLNASGGVSYLWQPSQYLSSTTVGNPVATPPLSKTYRVKITADVFGCASVLYDTVVITMYPLVVANAGRDTVVAINQPLQLQATGGVKYLWSPTYGLNNPNIATPVAILDRDITYTVKVSDVIGCSRNASINVKVFKGPEIYVPNAFTPNGDGINDIMQPIAIGFKSFDYFVIYNRWGEKVYETNNPKLGWNGVYKGVAQSTAGFVWMARGTAYTGAVVERKGTFVLIR